MNGVKMGILPDRNFLTQDEATEKELLESYTATIEAIFPELVSKWIHRLRD